MKKTELTKISLAILSAGLAILLYYSYNFYRFDDFFLYNHFQSQSYYAHQMNFPLLVIYESLINYTYENPVWLMLTFTIFITVIFYTKKIPLGWQLFMIGILLFTPTFGTTDCYYRHIVVAFPLYIMIGFNINSRMKKYFFYGYAVISIILTLTVYLPLFKANSLM
jgi:hypothetical protein